jgi:hypothetical protein
MLSKPTLADKYRIFIHEQLSYQKYVIKREEERGNHDASDGAHYRIHVYEELMRDLESLTITTEKKEERFKVTTSNKSVLLTFLKDNGGAATLAQIKALAKEMHRQPKSMEQLAMKLVRDGKLSRTGDKIAIAVETDE